MCFSGCLFSRPSLVPSCNLCFGLQLSILWRCPTNDTICIQSLVLNPNFPRQSFTLMLQFYL